MQSGVAIIAARNTIVVTKVFVAASERGAEEFEIRVKLFDLVHNRGSTTNGMVSAC